MNLAELYESYAAIERLPIDARAAAAVAAKHRSEVVSGLDERASRSRKESEATKARLQADLRSEAQAASAGGVIPKAGVARSGARPNFARARTTRQQLEALRAEEKRAAQDLERLQSELYALEQQIADELGRRGVWEKARAADFITFAIGGLSALLSLVVGSGVIGVGVLTAGLTFVGLRLAKGRSALMMRAATKRPAVGSHPKVRLGYVLTGVGSAAAIALVLDLFTRALLKTNGVDQMTGEVSRQGPDLVWCVALVVAVVVAAAGYLTQRTSR